MVLDVIKLNEGESFKLKVFGPESFDNCDNLTEATLWGEIKISELAIELIKIAKIYISTTLY